MTDENEQRSKSVNVKNEAVRLYLLQRDRIKIDVEIERKMRKTLPSLSNEIRIATELLRLVFDTEEVAEVEAGEDWIDVQGFDD